MSDYCYNAPQFYSSLNEVIELSDEDNFFDAKNENENLRSPIDKGKENKENVTISESEDESLNTSFSKIKIKSKFEGLDLPVENDRKSHPMLTRQDISILSPKLSLELRNRSVLKEVGRSSEDIQRPVVGQKRKASESIGHSNLVTKYRSLAENIYHFHRDTPPRFRRVSKKHSGFKFSIMPPSAGVTVPQSPHLLSKMRLRHCSDNCMSHEQRELKEIEAAKQSFKPQELNKKIFEPPKEVDREKHFTVPKPFNLTQQPVKKVDKPKESPFIFKAKPLPRSMYNSTECLRVSTNRLPILAEEPDEDAASVGGYGEASTSQCCKVKPFSFEQRDRLRAIRKQEKINQIIENEKKAAVFKATPLPAYLSDHMKSSLNSTCSSYHKHEAEEIFTEFKARPADVLHKKPFQPKKNNKTPTKFLDVKLNTEIRAQQRHSFDEHQRALKEEVEALLAKEAEEKKLKEEEEIAMLRKELVHKPLPLPMSMQSGCRKSSDSESENTSCNQ